MRKQRDFLVVFGKGLAMREKTGAMPQGKSWFEADGAEKRPGETRRKPRATNTFSASLC